jgi:hypothetical protein
MLPRVLVAAIFVLLLATVASADPLVLTSGSFSTFRSPNFGTNSGAASGPQLSFSGGFTNFDCGAQGCGSGNSGFLSSLNRANAGNGGSLTIDGVTYSAFVISFGFDANTVTGSINVFDNRDVPPGTPPLFTVDFVGSGFMNVTVLDPTTSRTFTTTFTVTSVPEPGSLFLIGLGVTGLALKLKRRRE